VIEIQGKVYLVGAGPGDPDLLTVKARSLIEEADVILYDRLVNEEVLRFARKDVRLIFVGKKPGRHLINQEEINKVIAREYKGGNVVVRLKGGDPFVLGRGGEEVAPKVVEQSERMDGRQHPLVVAPEPPPAAQDVEIRIQNINPFIENRVKLTGLLE